MPPEIPPQNCLRCGTASGTKIVCDACRRHLTKSQIQSMDAVFQRMIIELFGNACVDCGHSAATESGELCADHTEQKLSQPESRYDLAAAVCRCFDCHTKRHTGEVKRYPAKEKMPRQTQERAKKYTRPQCKCSPRCPMLPLENGYCIRSQPRKKS